MDKIKIALRTKNGGECDYRIVEFSESSKDKSIHNAIIDIVQNEYIFCIGDTITIEELKG